MEEVIPADVPMTFESTSPGYTCRGAVELYLFIWFLCSPSDVTIMCDVTFEGHTPYIMAAAPEIAQSVVSPKRHTIYHTKKFIFFAKQPATEPCPRPVQQSLTLWRVHNQTIRFSAGTGRMLCMRHGHLDPLIPLGPVSRDWDYS